MASDMDHILSPERINTFQYQSPVTCIVWRGQNAYERIQLGTVCPFDTIDMLKRLVYNHYQEPSFLPRFIFMGISDTAMEAMQNPTEDTQYLPVDFLWYPIGNNDPANTFHLANPVLGATDKRFLSQGLFSNPNYEERGRSTIEDVLIKPYGTIPVLHVFRFQDIRAAQAIQQKITPEEWYGKYIAYFPDIPFNSTYMPDAVDISFGRTITSYIEKRNGPLRQLERLLQQKSSEIKYSKLQTIQYIRLVWQRRIPTFDGSASLFYSIRASEKRPYIRLLPSQGIPITKLHVHGALPIPTVDDPRLLSVWTKETSPTPDKDACVIKYVHRPIMGTTQTIYGTIHVLNDGTMSLLLQPPQEMRGLDPAIDINNFARRLEEPFDGLPQPPNEFSIKDISLKLILDAAPGSKRFTDMRIRSRLPYFSDFFREIKKLPDDDAFIVLRYKAVSQYTSEDEYFQFITQVSTELKLEGEDLARTVVARIQATFVRTETEAQALFRKWLQRKGELMLLDPNEGEFAENNNSGIDIHIYAQHSGYHFQIHRISSIQTYERIYTLLSLLFMDKDEYFKETSDVVELKKAEDTMQKQSEIVAAAPKPVVPLMQKKRVIDIQAAIKQKLAAAAVTTDAPLSMAADVSAVMAQPVEPAVKSYAPLTTATAVTAPLFHAQQKMVNPASWFINKLEEIDKKLFTFTPPTGTKGYTSQCQANAGRQPVILTKELFERMREEYTDPDLFWIVYPLTKADKDPAPLDDDEVITVLRYGSNRNNINYIFCPEYYCLSCEIMVRKKDFEDVKERKRVTDPPEKVAERKPKNSCPFCHGSLITDSKRSVKGATVVYRKKTTNNKPQKYIQFIKNTNHPLGLSLPCCFSLSKPLRLHDVEFSKPDGIREQLQRTPAYISPVANEIDEDESDTESTTDEVVTGAINYKLRRERIHLDPILESNKNPYPGSAATVPPLFDTFFAQDSPKHIVTRPHINLKLRPNARGFVRMGTENSVYESLLGVLAPILEVNTISAVKQRIYQLVLPHIFINLHFGNLVLEFYNPADASSMPASRYALAEWTSENLRITLDSSNFYELIRVYNAYNRYIKFIDNPSERKEMRHIQALLAEPGLLRQNGVQLIIMENQKDNIAIKCPVFGLARRHHTNDYVFVSKTMRNIADTNEVYPHYELYLYTDNKPAKGKDVEKHKTIIHWDIATHDKWPAIVRDRVTEYKKMCKSRYTTLYTSSPTIKPDLIIQLSTALNRLRNTVVGIVKDVHNHIIAVTLSGSIVPTSAKTLPEYESMGGVVAAATGVKKGIKKIGAIKQIALPIIDDGIITTNLSMKTVYLNWNQFITSSAAPVEDVIRYYNDEITPVFVLFPGYQVQYVVKTPAGKVIAVQLQNSIYVPVANTKKPEKLQEIMEQYQIGYVTSNESDFQWNIDAQIDGKKDIDIDHMDWGNAIEQLMPDKRCGTEPDFIKQATHAEFEEQYQQFRYMVSNYITEPQIKQDLEKIIFTKNLPYYEKRQRLFIYLGSTLQSWFHEDDVWEGTTTFLRKDCRVSTKEGCTGSCYWKSPDDEKNDSGEGRCLLHVKREVSLDGTDERLVSTSDLFIKRMIDELISFPQRREQLLRKGAISKVSKILKPIRDIDQYIIPESSLAWTELLRMEWLTKPFDRPAFYEELSREGDEEKLLGQLPKPLQAIFGAATPLQLYIPEEQQGETPFLSIASMINVPLASIHVEANAQTLERDNLIEYVRQTHKPIGFIDIDTDTIQFAKETDSTFRKVLVIVRINNQIGILLENNNDNYIMINLLPDQITDNWIIVDSQPAPAVYPEVRPKGLRKIGAPITAAVEAQAPVKRGLAKIGKPAVKAPLAEAPVVVAPEVVVPAVVPSVVPIAKGISKIKKINTLRRNTPSAANP